GPLSLRSCAKLDCSNTLVTYGSTHIWRPFAVENSQIFWLDDGFDSGLHACGVLLSCDIAGCIGGPRQVDSVPIANCYSAAAFSSDAVYLCSAAPGGQLTKIPLSGAGPQMVLASPATCMAIAVHGNFVYWIGQTDSLSSPSLRRTRIDGSESQVLTEGNRLTADEVATRSFPQRLAFDSDYVYWSQGSLYGSIVRCPLSGCQDAPEIVAEPVRSPTSLIVDGSTLYFEHDTSSAGLAISSLLLPHGAPTQPLVTGVAAERAFAIDERYLYTATTNEVLAPVGGERSYVVDGLWTNPWASVRRISKTVESAQ
ncbi:MAG: hypothetical protein ABIQ16_18175, partial [Polyangiaceae bacterium]